MERRFISVNEAISLLPEGDTIHTFYNTGFALLGADWQRQDVIDKLAKSDKIEITGDTARSMNHGLAVYDNDIKYQSDILFIETNKTKLDKFDPAESVTLEQPKVISIDRIKQAREEIEQIKEPNMSDRTNNMVGREKVLSIIDKLIAESEEVND